MKKIMISAGEASGDINGAQLAFSIKKLCPSVELKGIGGRGMEAAGVRLLFDISELAVVGFSEVLRNFGKIKSVFYGFCREMYDEKPDAVVLIDYPGFNLRLAARAKKKNIKVVYYVSPQVWAWGGGRVRKIAAFVDRMIVIFPFEKEFYQKFKIEADYVGHPVADRLGDGCGNTARKDFRTDGRPVICLLPGSRRQEVARHLPLMLQTASLIKKKIPEAEFIIGRAGTISSDFIGSIAGKFPVCAEVRENGQCEALRGADFVIASSGTATVESAYLMKPMVVIYVVSAFTWVFARLLVKVENIAMVNVMAGKRIVPEFVQSSANPRAISEAAVSILSSKRRYDEMVAELVDIRKQLGPPGAGERAARLVLRTAGAEKHE